MSREEEFSIASYDCVKTGTTIIVNLQYRKGFLVLISEKGMEILYYFKSFNANYKKGQVDYFLLLLGGLILKVEFGHVLLVSLVTFS